MKYKKSNGTSILKMKHPYFIYRITRANILSLNTTLYYSCKFYMLCILQNTMFLRLRPVTTNGAVNISFIFSWSDWWWLSLLN